jgi:hypothetical protein
MSPDELRAAGELVGSGFGHAVVSIRETHGAVARRVFRSVGEPAKPVEMAHEAISELAYGSTRLLGRSLLMVAGQAGAVAAGSDAAPLERTAAGRFIKGALSGAFGDTLAAQGNPLVVPMAVRVDGEDVQPTPPALAAAFPVASGRLAVFLHGLCETEDAWRLHASRSRPYGDRLRDELGCTPVYVRYNTGLHISDNGRRLAALLEDVVRSWPVEVREIALIGHSMGGLVSRSACHYGGSDSLWTGKVAHVFTLGAPHSGAPLEQFAHAAACRLSRLPETRAWGRALNSRSVGIKDLGRGYLTDECWAGQDPEAYLRHTAREIPFLETANHYFVAASLAGTHDHRFGRHLGDLLVLHASAWGTRPGERLRFPLDHYRHVGGATHFDLLNHPAVAEQIVTWLSRRALSSASAA